MATNAPIQIEWLCIYHTHSGPPVKQKPAHSTACEANRSLPATHDGFGLTGPGQATKLAAMTKQELKHTLLEAVRRAPHFADMRSVALFGSYVTGRPTEDSDIDVLIDFDPSATIGFFALSDIKTSLQAALGKPVDLLTPQALSSHFRDQVLAQAESIYER